MMGSSQVTPMAAPRSARLRPLLLQTVALLSLCAAPSAAVAEAYVPFPSPETLRQVQLAALGCARENSSETCTEARKLADPLMDHPRLPGSCKDVLWAILQTAKPASSNSLARRDAITDPAQRLLLVCRSNEKPEATKEGEKKEKSGLGRLLGL